MKRKARFKRKHYRIRRKKSFLQNRFFWTLLFGLLIGSGFLYFFFLSPVFQVKRIEISGNEKVSSDDIRELIEKEITTNLFFKNVRNIFLADLDKTNKILTSQFILIANVNSSKEIPDKMIFEIEEKQAALLFLYNGKYFLLDKEGTVFEKVDNCSKSDISEGQVEQDHRCYQLEEVFQFEKLDMNNEPLLGQEVVTKETLADILKIKSKLESLDIKVSKGILKNERRFDIATREGWDIYFNLKEDLDWQLTKIALMLEKEISPEKRGELQYIDLRFDKAYYK